MSIMAESGDLAFTIAIVVGLNGDVGDIVW